MFATTAFAAEIDKSLLLLSDGNSVEGSVTTISDGKVVLTTPERSYASGKWVRWSNPSSVAPRPHVYFGNRSVVVAKKDWTGKVPITIDEQHVVLQNQTLGKVTLARQQVRLVLITSANEPTTTLNLLAESTANNNRDTDLVWLTEGDLLSGHVSSFDGVTLDLELAGETVSLAASRVAACSFANREAQQAASNAAYLVGLDDGTILESDRLSVNANGIELSQPVAGELKASSPKSLRFVQNQTRSITYLSDVQPLDYKQTPYFDQAWPLARDQSPLGRVPTVSGRRYAKCLAMHAAARAVYAVPAGARKFCAELAIDDSAQRRGSVVFRAYLATGGSLTKAYESPVVRGGDEPVSLSVDLADASALVLVVDYADRGDELDHALWLDARFVE